MRGNTFGKLFSITTFGESHGTALGVVVDGCPPGLTVNVDELWTLLKRRAPGHALGATKRFETDQPEILSGVFEGRTLGTPIAVLVRNTQQRSQDYDKIKFMERPGHADRTTLLKYGVRDHRGGGRSSGRETVGRVIGGYFARLVLPEMACKIFLLRLGPLHFEHDFKKHDLAIHGGTPDEYGAVGLDQRQQIQDYLLQKQKNGESVPFQVSVRVSGVPAALGEPVFDKLKADLAKAIFSIGGSVAIDVGAGEEFLNLEGHDYVPQGDLFGGQEGGMTNGGLLILKITFKAPSTVGPLAKEGRHDPCLAPRVFPVIESMIYLVLADHYLRQQAYHSFSSLMS
jgi:chorismate synthase